MRTYFALLVGKLTHLVTRIFSLGAGGTWPGEIALSIAPDILVQLFKQLNNGIVIVAGTNGKTTTSLMLTTILVKQGKRVVHNATGANLLNGVVSALINQFNWFGNINADWGVFEVDENTLPSVISNFQFPISNGQKLIVVLLNLFRDQLDRYGEVDVIAEKWQKAIAKLDQNTVLILNADDPQIAYLGFPFLNKESEVVKSGEVLYFGINDKTKFLKQKEHATDSTFCLNCGSRLHYEGIYFSHLGIWSCEKCGEKRPDPDLETWESPLPGLYNYYNTLAAVSVAKTLNINDKVITQALTNFKPAFGRQEEFFVTDKLVKIFLSKNPAGFNASLRTVLEQNPKVILLVLNDRIPDGRDVSWIWDVDFELILNNVLVLVSGDRVYDMVLRMKYADRNQKSPSKADRSSAKKIKKYIIEPNISNSIKLGLDRISGRETLYILPTYSAMLEVRKMMIGRKIL